MEKIEKIPSPKTLWHCINSELPLEAQPLSAILSILKDKVEQIDTEYDWGDSLYLAEIPSVSIGYADDTKGIPYLVELELVAELPCVISDDKVYMGEEYREVGTSVPTENIKSQVETLFSVPICQTPFMTYMGKRKHAYQCYVDRTGNLELIVPSSMVSEKYFKVRRVIKLNKNRYSGYYEMPS